MAEPSPIRPITLRSGHAMAAPIATGMPYPMEPPQLLSQVCFGAPLVTGKKARPVVIDSSTTIASSGIARAIRAASAFRLIGPLGRSGKSAWATCAGAVVAAPVASQSAVSAAIRPAPASANVIISASSRVKIAGFPGYAKNPIGARAPTRTMRL